MCFIKRILGMDEKTPEDYAIQNGPTHVSIYPIGGTMEDWYNAGADLFGGVYRESNNTPSPKDKCSIWDLFLMCFNERK